MQASQDAACADCPLAELFTEQVVTRPNDAALYTAGEMLTFCQLYSRASSIKESILASSGNSRSAESTARGRRRPIVAVACGGTQLAELCAVLAVVLAGGCFVPIEERLPAARLRQVLEDVQPDVLLRSCTPIGDDLEASTGPGCVSLKIAASGMPISASADQDARSASGAVGSRFVPVPMAHSAEPEERASTRRDPLSSTEDNQDLLYILYTSGTTGMPKGVKGTRSGAIKRIRSGWALFPLHPHGERVARRTPACFVDFVAEIFSPLLAGVPLALAPDGAAGDPLRLVPALEEMGATRITLTPSLLSSLLRTTSSRPGPLLPKLSTWLVSGEALHPDLVMQFRSRAAPGAQLINLYGSTEVAGDATYCTLEEIMESRRALGGSDTQSVGPKYGRVLIGKPLPGVELAIVGVDLLPVSSGDVGELLVGGDGVALGYHDRPLETAAKFLTSASREEPCTKEHGLVHIEGLGSGRRVFRTGDRVCQPVAGGPFFWLGKMDGEVKVRGVRVSLEEVEVLAAKAAGFRVGSFAVAYDQDEVDATDGTGTQTATISAPDRGRLIAFFSSGRPEDILWESSRLAILQAKLRAEMTPAQMPAVLVPVESFPLTANGKVDKRLLLHKYRKSAIERTSIHPRELATLRPRNTQSDKEREHNVFKQAIAQAVLAVLPDADVAIKKWFEDSAGHVNLEKSTTFADLGGTSLQAVEAAWLASRHVQLTIADDSNSPTLLIADDLLVGSLQQAAEKLRTRMQTDFDRAESERGALATGSTRVTAPASREHIERSLSSRKKPRQASLQSHTVRPTPFLAIGRAGAGLRHSAACLGAIDSSERGQGAAVTSVELRVMWKSDLTKCVDASPLVVFPKETQTLATRGAKVEESCECLCAGRERAPAESGVGDRSTGPRGGASAGEEAIVYIGSHSGEFQALDVATGRRVWSFVAGDRIETAAACSADGLTVFVGCHDRRLYALERRTGVALWAFETGDVIKCTPVCVSLPGAGADAAEATGSVLVGSHDGILRNISAANGTLLWSFDCRGPLFASAAYDERIGVVFAASTKGRVVALRFSLSSSALSQISSGTRESVGGSAVKGQPVLLWEQLLPACFSTPVVCRGCVILGCVDGGLYCFSSAGQQLWVSRQGSKPVFASPCLLPSPLVSPDGNAGVEPQHVAWACHDGFARRQRGAKMAWETDIGRGHGVFSSPFFVAAACEKCSRSCPLIFACTIPGDISALSESDGSEAGRIKLPGEIFSSPVIVGRTLIVGCRDNNVYALKFVTTCSQCQSQT